MIMFSQGLDNDVIDRGDGRVAPALLLDASPANLGAPAGMLVEPPLAYLNHQIPTLREIELWLCKWKNPLPLYLRS